MTFQWPYQHHSELCQEYKSKISNITLKEFESYFLFLFLNA